MNNKPVIAMVAGEASGDQLGGALIVALRQRFPQAKFVGVGGDRMRQQGFEAWWDSDEIAVMGLFEVLRHLPRLFGFRRKLRERLIASQPDIFIGIDAPDFNLGLEKQLRRKGIHTVHYVSPTVWAWRQGRAAKMADSADMVLCLFPFEPAFYQDHGVTARYAGHPMADSIDLDNDRERAREALGQATDGLVIGLLPGSRVSEVERLATPLLDAAEQISRDQPEARFIVPLANQRVRELFTAALGERVLTNVELVDGRSLEVMAASDVVVCASGTATLECMLVGRPMVVVYRMSPVSLFVMKDMGLYKADYFSLPNILAGETLVPELLQDDVNGSRIAEEVSLWLNDPSRCADTLDKFRAIHEELRIDAAQSAADVISETLGATG